MSATEPAITPKVFVVIPDGYHDLPEEERKQAAPEMARELRRGHRKPLAPPS